MEFRLLGTLEVVRDQERLVDVGRPKQRALLALLLLQANRVVSVSAIVDGLWGEDPPPSAANVVQGYVSRLRRALRPEVELATIAPGYRLEVPAEDVDSSD
jgi:DNA-binding SARP family transcriptional activator